MAPWGSPGPQGRLGGSGKRFGGGGVDPVILAKYSILRYVRQHVNTTKKNTLIPSFCAKSHILSMTRRGRPGTHRRCSRHPPASLSPREARGGRSIDMGAVRRDSKKSSLALFCALFVFSLYISTRAREYQKGPP